MSGNRAEHFAHLNHNIAPFGHTPMYVWHKFWGRKTWNVVGQYIKTYCPEGGIVFDPFAGSGVTAMEALRHGRRVIVCDLNPVATEIVRLTIQPVSETKLQEAYERVATRVKDKILSLYRTQCRKCGYEFPATCFIWDKGKCVEVRYDGCPSCGDIREKDCPPNARDKKLVQRIETAKIKEWYPQDRLYYPDGAPFKEKQQYDSLDELFTKRNLQALAWLMEAIEGEANTLLRDFLKIGFTSMVHLCSRMRGTRREDQGRPFSGPGWNQHSYWYAKRFLETNVWNNFERTIVGRQGLLAAKCESNPIFKDKTLTSNYQRVLEGKADACIVTGDCVSLMKKMARDCVDYIFTDPPYDASIQYGELSFLWAAWLKRDKKYLENLVSYEVVRNDKQGKDFEVYQALLRGSFAGMFKVLKPDSYLTLTFHNPTFKVRNATIRTGVFSRLEFEHIHHQPLAASSPKSLLQPFGSAQGDFYMRFHKPPAPAKPETEQRFDEALFEKIVVDSTIAVLAERAEPTPYTIIINYIDPQLAKHGYFSSLTSGLDVNKVLEAHLNKEFVLVQTKLGGAEGKLWWFKDPNIVPHLKEVPLSERVEQTVLRQLQAQGRVTFTDIWNEVSVQFPNSLTSDSTSIKESLETYARPVANGEWLLKSEFTKERVRSDHNEILGILAVIGKARGHDVWIGNKEQSESTSGLLGADKKLRDLMTVRKLQLEGVANLPTVEDIDLLWLEHSRVVAAFEVESTTTMTSALWRGSNLSVKVPKFMVIPEQRKGEFERKFRSPLFAEHFVKDNWKLIYFDALRHAYTKDKGKVDIDALVGIPRAVKQAQRELEQLNLI